MMRSWINLVENIGSADVQKYKNEVAHYKNEVAHYTNERAKYWPVSPKLMASYRDGSHSEEWTDGHMYWRKNDQLHREGDKPAYMGADGRLEWYKNGDYHRDDDKPAMIYADGTLRWFKNGEEHRDVDKPAWIGGDGSLAWFKNNLRNRNGDKPAYIGADGSLAWFKNDKRHRLLGPAVIDENNKFEWWFKGNEIPVKTQEEHLSWLEKNGLIDVYRLRKS